MTNHSLPDKFFTSESSTLLKQITSNLSEMALILDTALCDLKRDIDGHPLQEKHISAADTKKANRHKAEKTTACTCKPPLTIPTDNVRSAVALQRCITRSMTATTRRKNICMSDADKAPWDHSVAITGTEYIDEPNNDGTSWNKGTSNAEAVDATDSINGSSNNDISQNSADLTAERTTKENNGTAVKDADCNDETNDDNIFWSCRKDMTASIRTPKNVTMTKRTPSPMQQYRAVQHRHPLTNLTSASSPPKIPTDYANNPVTPMANR
jgi:hypothetical protein